jgi:hypothetical protein
VRLAVLLLLLAAPAARGQAVTRRVATITSLHAYPGFYHLQNVVLRGELTVRDREIVLHADDGDLRVLLQGATLQDGPVEVRGQMIDVGRLTADDPRLTALIASGTPELSPDHWPHPGDLLIVNVTSVTATQPVVSAPTIRDLALQPWKFDGQMVTVTGNFRGRNLFGDVGGAPNQGRYDFVLRGSEGAVWVTGMRPKGKGFDFDIDRRIDTNQWLQVEGMVARKGGLVTIQATAISLAQKPEDRPEPTEDTSAPPVPILPGEVVFSTPTGSETDVRPTTTVRIQFSRGLKESTIDGHLRATYSGTSMPLDFTTTYDAATRSVEMKFAASLKPFSTVHVETLDGLKTFDDAPVTTWSLTFSVGG